MKEKNKIYFENLDGLRFICFLSVFFFHSFHTDLELIKSNQTYLFFTNTLFKNGNLGVNCFFVLSGFLITYLLIIEKKTNNNISIFKFWLRRVFRIWPLFYLCLFFGFFIFPQIKILFNETPNETADLWSYIFFLNNFNVLNNGTPDASVLGVLWSIAVEEQFYFFWPLILYFVPTNRFWIPFLLIIFQSIIFRYININDEFTLEIHTQSCISDMAVGALGAWLILFHKKAKKFVVNMSKNLINTLYIFFLIIYIFKTTLFEINIILNVLERLVVSVVFLLIILEQNFSKNSFFKFSRFSTISDLGKITYGLYCLHFIGILSALKITSFLNLNNELWHVILLETALALIISIILSKIIYKYFESPFLQIKNRFK